VRRFITLLDPLHSHRLYPTRHLAIVFHHSPIEAITSAVSTI